VPLSEIEVTRILSEKSIHECVSSFREWLLKSSFLNNRFQYVNPYISKTNKQQLYIKVKSPYKGRIGFRFLDTAEIINHSEDFAQYFLEERKNDLLDLLVIFLCVDESKSEIECIVRKIFQNLPEINKHLLVLEPTWTSAILVEKMLPIFSNNDLSSDSNPKSSNLVLIKKESSNLKTILGTVIDDPGTYSRKLRLLRKEEAFEGTVFLCTTYLPPITHPTVVAERFYQSIGTSKETLKLIRERADWEKNSWLEHIRNHQRFDIIDRHSLEEYFAAPEYYQMPINRDELSEQLKNMSELLNHDNYKLCLTPEAIDIPFEIQGKEVKIRTDRRNKGQPRVGRITGIVLNDQRTQEMFEREFWTLFRLTEPEFKEKNYIEKWLKERAIQLFDKKYTPYKNEEIFDVFLCHNKIDKSVVKEIGTKLKDNGIKPWLDEWNLIPGRPWQKTLETQIKNIKCAAIFVGESGIGPWENLELDAFIREFINRGCPVIPVILPYVKETPTLPIFLNSMHHVDFRVIDPDPLEKLILGISANIG
jgi:hypothetical protein